MSRPMSTSDKLKAVGAVTAVLVFLVLLVLCALSATGATGLSPGGGVELEDCDDEDRINRERECGLAPRVTPAKSKPGIKTNVKPTPAKTMRKPS